MLFLSYDKIVIIPTESIDHRSGYNDQRRYGIGHAKVYCHKFNNYDRVKLHYLNLIHKDMCIDDDGFIQLSVNGPGIILTSQNLHSKTLYDKYMKYSKESKGWFSIEDVDVYVKLLFTRSYFNSKKRVKRRFNDTKSILVPLQ